MWSGPLRKHQTSFARSSHTFKEDSSQFVTGHPVLVPCALYCFCFGVLLVSLPLALVTGSGWYCVHWTPPFLDDLVSHILLNSEYFLNLASHLLTGHTSPDVDHNGLSEFGLLNWACAIFKLTEIDIKSMIQIRTKHTEGTPVQSKYRLLYMLYDLGHGTNVIVVRFWWESMLYTETKRSQIITGVNSQGSVDLYKCLYII
jgi:hypothetical protein